MKDNLNQIHTRQINLQARRFDRRIASDFSNVRVLIASGFCSVGLFLTVISCCFVVPKASAQSLGGPSPFTAVGSMSEARYQPTATLLGNGKVLIAGGGKGFGMIPPVTNTAELFDPASGDFTPTSSMTWPRAAATATLLPSGKVLIAGGYMPGPPGHESNYRGLNTAELFDPASGTFTALAPMTSARSFHTATLLPSGKVLITGGEDLTLLRITNTAEIFDPASGTFTPTSSMPWERIYHTATLLPSGKVLIVGGYGPPVLNGSINKAELFDPASGTFTPTSSMTITRMNHTATLLPNGKVLVAGGFDANTLNGDGPDQPSATAELFDPASGTFTVVANLMTSPRYTHTATLLPSGKVLITGGIAVWLLGPSESTNTAELFDPVSGNFTSLLPDTMTSRRESPTATLLANGKVLIAGGSDWGADGGAISGPPTILNTAELFDGGVSFSDARRPVISTAPDTLIQPASLVLTGTGFRGDSEASGGSFANSSTNYPLVQLTRIDNEQSFFVLSDPATNWSDTSFTSETLSNLAPGQYRVTVFTNAIPSLPKIINIALPVQLVSVVSRMTHGSAGTFDVDLPLTGARGIECRSGGANGDYQMVFSFVNNVTNCGTASTGSLSSGPGLNQCTVNLTGVPNQQYLTVTLNNVLDSQTNTGNVAATMGVLIGDVNADGGMSNLDVSLVKAKVAAGASVDSSNFRDDVNADGGFSNLDVSITKGQVAAGAQLPTPP